MGRRVIGSNSDSVHQKVPAGTYGDVFGPASAVNNNFVFFDTTTGKLIKDNGISLSTDVTLAGNSDLLIPSQKAIKTYVDGKIVGSTANYIESYGLSNFDGSVTVSGTAGTFAISPFTKNITSLYFFNRNSAGTHYPIQVAIWQTTTPSSNTPTFTKLAQSGDIACTTDGIKSLSGVSVPIVQGYGYYFTFSRASGGGSTTPLVCAQANGFNRVLGNFAASDLANATPANFAINVSANTIGTWTGGTSSAGCPWFIAFCS
jgi:hypothetical protein